MVVFFLGTTLSFVDAVDVSHRWNVNVPGADGGTLLMVESAIGDMDTAEALVSRPPTLRWTEDMVVVHPKRTPITRSFCRNKTEWSLRH